jgi:hypothetical protein
MLKRDITYEDFNGEQATDTFYFNLTKTEILDLEVRHNGGLEASITRMVKAQDVKAVIDEVKYIILMAYGLREADGKRFIKSDELREAFSQTAAFDALFMELAVNDEAATKFIRGILPKDVVGEMTAPLTSMPPPPATTVPPDKLPPMRDKE